MARKPSITKRRRELFLERLKQSGSVTKAAIAGEVGRGSWYDLRHKDPDFEQEWDDAELEFLDNCEAEAIRRGVFGVDENVPYLHVINQEEKETRFRTVNRRSDRLLELTLKSRHPSYAPKQSLDIKDISDTVVSPKSDLTKLSDAELDFLERILTKASGRMDVDSTGES